MPIATIFDLELGSPSATREPAVGPAVYGVLVRPRPLPPLTFMMWSVGSITTKTYLQARESGVIASGMIPIVPVLTPESAEEELVEDGADKLIDLVEQFLDVTFGSSMQERDGGISLASDTTIDEMVPTWDAVPNAGIRVWRDRVNQYFATENIWLTWTMTEIQAMITDWMLSVKSIQPQPRMVGYGLCRAEEGHLRIVKRVSDIFTWKGENRAKLRLLRDPWKTIEKRDQYLHLMILARAMLRCIPERLDKNNEMEKPDYRKWYRTNDMIAFINDLLLAYGAPGNPGTDHPYTASEILDGIFTTVGMGLSESDRYLLNSQSSIKKWLTFCVLFGLVSQRTKGTVGEIEIRLEKTKLLLPIVVDFFNHVMGIDGHQYDLPSGSTTPWHPMAKNIIPAFDLPMPMIIAEETSDMEHEENDYSWVLKPIASFDAVEARFGKLSKVLVEPMPTEEVRRIIRVHYDMQRYDVPRVERSLKLWTIGYTQVFANSGMTEDNRRFNWFYGLLFANSNFGNGYAMAPQLNLFSTQQVAYGATKMGETTVMKEDTETKGRQEPAPNGLPLSTDTTDDSHVAKATAENKSLGQEKKNLEVQANPAQLHDKET